MKSETGPKKVQDCEKDRKWGAEIALLITVTGSQTGSHTEEELFNSHDKEEMAEFMETGIYDWDSSHLNNQKSETLGWHLSQAITLKAHSPSAPVPSGRLYLLTVPQSPQTVPPNIQTQEPVRTLSNHNNEEMNEQINVALSTTPTSRS